MKQIYLFLLLCCIGFTARGAKTYSPASLNPLVGAGSYCQGAAASPLTITYTTCNGGGGAATGTTCTVSWYYNLTNSTTVATATLLVSTPFTSVTTATGTQSYTPSTATAGTLYYFCVINYTGGAAACGTTGSFTSPNTQAVTVNAAPAALTGTASMCMGGTTVLSSTTGGGVWSSSPGTGNATVSAGTVTGTAVGTATISYTVSGCSTTQVVTVNAAPAAITGPTSVCSGSVITLANTVTGGTWSGSPVSTVTVGSATGSVTGGTAGTATISYTTAGCTPATYVVTVLTTPSAISGPSTVCLGSTITLASTPTGGAWTSSVVATASVDAAGVVTGNALGNTTITYNLGGCIATKVVTVVASPSAITGPSSVSLCGSGTITLSDATAGGVWSSSTAGVGTISSSGVVTAIGTGTTTISYAIGSCVATTIVTVTATLSPITGPTTVCVLQTITLSDITGGGTWSSAPTTVATVGSSSGIVTGVAPGGANITYTVGGCFATMSIGVSANPAPITPLSAVQVCVGGTAAVADGSSPGTWSSTPAAIATIAPTGTISGIATGTANITYTLSTGCYVTKNITVNPNPTAITGTTNVCMGNTTTLASTPTGGTWGSSASATASVGLTSGIVSGVSGGIATISYILGTGCYATTPVNVGIPPAAITSGDSSICAAGDTVTLYDSITGGTWSSSTAATATVGSSTGLVVSGTTVGTVLISYTTPGCTAVTKTITVEALPSAISGIPKVCNGDSTTLYNTSPGGRWSSSNLSLATIDSVTGRVYGIAMGTLTVTYKMPAGCLVTITITVNPLAPIAGDTAVCESAVTYLTDIVGGGTWTSSNPIIASANVTTGAVTGLVPGISYIVYLLPTGCTTSFLITVLPALSSISGTLSICTGSGTTLANPSAGGIWTSSNAFVASIDSVTGAVSGLFPDTTTVTYTMPHGCVATALVTVNPLPVPAITYNSLGHSLSTGSFTAYQWYDGVTGPISGATNATLTSVNYNHYYSVTVTDANGCQGTATWYGAVGVTNFSSADIHIFPNPATDRVFIESPVAVKAVLTGMEGKVITEAIDAKSIDISTLPNGLYLLSLYDDSGNKLVTQKLLKQ